MLLNVEMDTFDSERTTLEFIPGGVHNNSGLLGSGYPVSIGQIDLFEYPNLLNIKITVPNQVNIHHFQATIDRAQLVYLTQTNPTAIINFQLNLTESD